MKVYSKVTAVHEFWAKFPAFVKAVNVLPQGSGAGHTQGGFDILSYFHAKFPAQGPNARVKYSFPGSECMIFIMLMPLK